MEPLEKDVELHDGVKLVIARMKSHPEEFAGALEPGETQYTISTSRWNAVLNRYWRVLTEQEQTAVLTALREANRENFHHAVMSTIMEDKSKEKAYEYEVKTRVSGATQMPLPGMLTATEFANTAISMAPLFDTNK